MSGVQHTAKQIVNILRVWGLVTCTCIVHVLVHNTKSSRHATQLLYRVRLCGAVRCSTLFIVSPAVSLQRHGKNK